MLSTSTKILLETLAALLVVVFLAAGYGLWRLSEGPWAVPTLTPLLQAALSDQATGRSVTLGETLLIWEPDSLSVGIEIRNVTVAGRDGTVRARIADMSLRVAGLALLRGRIMPTEITILGSNVQLARAADGSVEFAIAAEEGAAGQAELADPREVAQALLSPGGDSPLASLRQIHLVGSTLSIDDRLLGTSWRARNLALSVVRVGPGQPPGFTANASLDLDIFGKPAAITLAATYDLGTDRLVADATVAKLEPARLAQQVASLAQLVAFDIILDASLHSVSTIGGAVSEARLSLSGTNGHFAPPAFAAGGIALDAFACRLAYQADQDTLTLEDMTAAIEQRPVLSASGKIVHPFGAATIEGTAKVVDLPVDSLIKLWPTETAPGGRSWVASNLTGGSIHAAEAQFAATGAAADPGLTITKLDANFDFSGLRVAYIPKMPTVEQVSGTGHIDLDHLTVAVAGGRLRGLGVGAGSIELTDFQRPLQQVIIDLPIKGPVPDMLTLINEPPLGWLGRFGIPPSSTAGAGDIRLQLKFPAIAKLTTAQIQVNAVADVTGLMVPKLIHDNDLSDGTLHLDIDRNGLKASGTATMAHTPVSVTWTENFNRTAPFQRRIDAAGTADEAARAAFGLDFAAPYVAGPADFTLTYTDLDGHRADLVGSADLRQSKLAFDALGWSKPADTPASAKFALKLTDGDISDFTQADYEGGGLAVQATGRLAKGALASLELRRLAIAQTNIAGSLARRANGGWDARIRGSSFDAHRWFASGSGSSDDSSFEPSFPLGLDVEIDRLLLDGGEAMAGVALRANYDGTRWQQASLQGRVGNGDVTLTLRPGHVTRHLDIAAGDAGALLKALGLIGQVQGGTLKLSGELDNLTPRLTAHIEGSNYQIRRAGAFAQLLALISITGIPDVMNGEGIAFQSFTGDLVRTPAKTELTRAQASGLSIGLTAKGGISRPDGKLDLAGVIVPINSLNRMIGAIPLLGNLLTGGPGGGLFAVSYRLTGTSDDPSVSVNPLSVLAPGVLRNLLDQFQLPTGGATTQAPEPDRPGTN